MTDTHVNEEKVISEAIKAYKLHQGKLGNKEKISFNLRLWMDEKTEAVDEVMEASWQGKITVTANYVPKIAENLMVKMKMRVTDRNGNTITDSSFDDPTHNIYNDTYTQDGKYSETLKKIIFQNTISPYTNAEEKVDFSEAQDESVLGYYVKNDDDTTYTLYIQANGKIKVNQTASYYFMTYLESNSVGYVSNHDFQEIEGIENLDTSLVTDMSHMFYGISNKSLDLKHFDTSKVIDMSWMFAASLLTYVDVSSFDTRRVTNMAGMFAYGNEYGLPLNESDSAHGLESLDIRHFDTSKVTDMSYMFLGCERLTSLDLSNFDTSRVTNMSAMFELCGNLTNLDISHFDTRNVTDMSRMFEYTEMASIDLSGFDTSNVTNMEMMFYSSYFTSLNLSNFDTSRVTNMRGMFNMCYKLTTTINITNPNVENYDDMFYEAAIEEGAQITVNYTTETSDLVDKMIATKSSNSNVVKGSLIS